MCGIAGLVRAPGVQPDADVIQWMTDVLRHRGPDFGATVIRDNVALGHRRLSIIDLSTDANQPMVSDDGTVAIVFNGEIYNFQAIRDELTRAGHRFRTHSDTEVLLEAWRAFGPDCVQRLRGMFAFAIHDRTRGLLFLARDRLGKKPLFYARGPGWFAFGSEIKAVRASGLISNDLDETALVQYVTYGYPIADRSIFAGIHKLPPGHTLTLRTNTPHAQPAVSRYWQLRFAPEDGRTEAEWVEELDKILSEAVRLRMLSDVPLGAFLSGGVDSSLVTALMCAHSPGRVKTFTIGFREKRFDESQKAAAVAQHLGTDHHCEIVTPDALSALPDLVRTYDEPFGDESAIPTLLLSRFTRSQVTVALSGDGGDELFAGYMRYSKTLRLRRAARAITPLGRAAARSLAGTLPVGMLGRPTIERLGIHPDQQYDHAMGWSPSNLSLLRPELRGALGGSAYRAPRPGLSGAPETERMQAMDISAYLPDDILVKVDRASMRHSLEVRCPLLDHELVELSARIPAALKLSGTIGKIVLRSLAERYIPANILNLPKQGFAVPLNQWFKHELRASLSEMFNDQAAVIWRYFDARTATNLAHRNRLGHVDASNLLWRLLYFHHWSRCCL